MALDQPVERGPSAEPAADSHRRWDALAPALVGAGALIISIVVHYVLATQQEAPWLMGDELRYAEMAKDFLDHGRLLFREEPTSFATAYPVLIAPAWSATDMATTYDVAKAINVLLMTSSAMVAFVWTRRLVPVVYAGVAAGLVLLLPTFAYTGMLMTENAAIPAFLLAVYAIARALEQPSLRWQVAVFPLIGLAATIRVQVVTLALVYPTAIFLDACFASRARARGFVASLRRFTPSFAILVVGAVSYGGFKLLSGRSLTTGLGAYNTVAEVDYSFVDVARWSVWHAGELAFSVGLLPAIAFGVLLAAALRRCGLAPDGDRALVAVTTAAMFWFVIQAAAFASRFSVRIEERYMVYAAPLLLVAFAVWLGRGLPRTGPGVYAAAIVPTLLVMTIPYERLFNVPILADTFGLIPLMRLSTVVEGIDDIRIAVATGAIVATVAFLVVSRRVAEVLFPAAVALFFVLSAYTVYGAVDLQSRAARAAQRVSDLSWVDQELGTNPRVGFVFGPSVGVNPHALWQTEFWNRSIDGVYPLQTDPSTSYSHDEVTVNTSGRLVPKAGGRPIDEPYLVADPALGLAGTVVAKPGPLALIKVDRPVHVANAIDGVYPDGWSSSLAGFTQYAPLPDRARRMSVRTSREGWGGADVPSRVTISAGPLEMVNGEPTLARATAVRNWVAHSGQGRTFVLPVPPAPFRIEVEVAPTFSPAQFGQSDTRQLGVQLSFAPETG